MFRSPFGLDATLALIYREHDLSEATGSLEWGFIGSSFAASAAPTGGFGKVCGGLSRLPPLPHKGGSGDVCGGLSRLPPLLQGLSVRSAVVFRGFRSSHRSKSIAASAAPTHGGGCGLR